MPKQTIVVNLNAYKLKAIQRAAFEFQDKSSIKIDIKNSSAVISVYDSEISESIFFKSILDHQLRIDAEESFGFIRTVLVAQALSPNKDISNFIGLCSDHDDSQ